MTDADKRPFAEAMQMLCAVYRVEPTKPLLAGYFIALSTTAVKLPEAQAAIVWALGNGGKFMPTAHELREQVFRSRRRPWRDPVTAADRKRIDTSWANAPRQLLPAARPHAEQSRSAQASASDPAGPAAGGNFTGGHR